VVVLNLGWMHLKHFTWLKCVLVLGLGREDDSGVRPISFDIKTWPGNLSMKLQIREGMTTALA